MLTPRSGTHHIKNFKAIPHTKKVVMLVLTTDQVVSNYPLNIKMSKEIMNELLRALPHTRNSRVSVRYYIFRKSASL